MTLECDAEQTPPLVAAPRHLRLRRFRGDVPDPLLVPGAEPFVIRKVIDRPAQFGRTPKPSQESDSPAYRRKRTVALWGVILVSLSVPALALALVFAG